MGLVRTPECLLSISNNRSVSASRGTLQKRLRDGLEDLNPGTLEVCVRRCVSAVIPAVMALAGPEPAVCVIRIMPACPCAEMLALTRGLAGSG